MARLFVPLLALPMLAAVVGPVAAAEGESLPTADNWVLLALAAVALLLNGLFILAQSSIAAAGPEASEGKLPALRWLTGMLAKRRAHERRFWAGSVFFMILALALLAQWGRRAFPETPLPGSVIAVFAGLMAHFMAIEVFCRNLALSRPFTLLPWVLPPAWLLAIPLRPLLIPFHLIRGGDPFTGAGNSITDMELRILPSLRGVDRILDEEAFEMIDSVREFTEATAEDIMTPRTEVEGVDLLKPGAELYDRLRAAVHSRLVVYEGDLDHVVGTLLVKEVLLQRPQDAMSLLRKPVVAEEKTRLPELLRLIRANRTHLVIVLDEYGGMAGVVTLHDLLESIVGHIEDIDDADELWIEKLDATRYRLNGRVELWEINEELGLHLEEDGARTIGGYVFNALGRLPDDGDVVEADRARIVVESTRDTRVESVLLQLAAESGEFPGAEAAS